VYFITELMSSGNLKSFIRKTQGPLKLKVVKNLCRHILRGLVYLHSHCPPIIHRDLKCDVRWGELTMLFLRYFFSTC
jgi:WNK lysine deficient protein kinase